MRGGWRLAARNGLLDQQQVAVSAVGEADGASVVVWALAGAEPAKLPLSDELHPMTNTIGTSAKNHFPALPECDIRRTGSQAILKRGRLVDAR
jgi:hypothetical protein